MKNQETRNPETYNPEKKPKTPGFEQRRDDERSSGFRNPETARNSEEMQVDDEAVRDPNFSREEEHRGNKPRKTA